MYNKNSLKAEEFIDHQEVLDTLEYAEQNKSNVQLIDEIIDFRFSSEKDWSSFLRISVREW